MSKKILISIFSSALLLIIGYFDYSIDPNMSLLMFYLIPIFIMTWYLGLPGGIFMLLGSAAAWSIDDCHSFSMCPRPLVPFWNLGLNFILCVSFIFSILLIKKLLEKVRIQNKKLQELDERKSDFVSHVAHEFKNPLFVIKESLNMTMEEKGSLLSDKQKNLLGYAVKDTRRLIRLVSDLLDLSKIESGKVGIKKEKLNLQSLTEEIIASREPEYSKKSITVKKYVDNDPVFVYADSDGLSEVIINLLDNAIKYSPAGSEIKIKFSGNNKEIRFEISDNGPGIEKNNIEKIFDKFERIITDNQEGTGLGLPIAKDIINLHKGKIWVESEPGKGSRFIFTLPKE